MSMALPQSISSAVMVPIAVTTILCTMDEMAICQQQRLIQDQWHICSPPSYRVTTLLHVVLLSSQCISMLIVTALLVLTES